jgi:hypothetical protein
MNNISLILLIEDNEQLQKSIKRIFKRVWLFAPPER